MSEPLFPEILTRLRQSAADGNAHDLLHLHLLERVEALEARPIPGSVELAADCSALDARAWAYIGKQAICGDPAAIALIDLLNEHATPEAAPLAAPAGGLVERVAAAIRARYPRAFRGEARPAIREVAAWLDQQGQHGCSLLLREEADR
jgi:hypothetical protein